MATSQDPLTWRREEDDIKELSGIAFEDSLRAAEDRERWKGIVAASLVVSTGISHRGFPKERYDIILYE